MIVQLAGSDVANRTASKDSSYNKRPQVINLKQKKKKARLSAIFTSIQGHLY